MPKNVLLIGSERTTQRILEALESDGHQGSAQSPENLDFSLLSDYDTVVIQVPALERLGLLIDQVVTDMRYIDFRGHIILTFLPKQHIDLAMDLRKAGADDFFGPIVTPDETNELIDFIVSGRPMLKKKDSQGKELSAKPPQHPHLKEFAFQGRTIRILPGHRRLLEDVFQNRRGTIHLKTLATLLQCSQRHAAELVRSLQSELAKAWPPVLARRALVSQRSLISYDFSRLS